MNWTIGRNERFEEFNLSAYRDALQLAKVGIWELNLQTGQLHLSDEHIVLLGSPAISGTISTTEYVERFVYEEDRELLADVAPKIQSGQWNPLQTEVEYRIIHPDGALHHVYVKMNFNHLNQNKLWGITQNITKTREAEKELNQTSRLLEDLKFALDESTLVTVTDVKGRITYVNGKFCSISGYSKDELIGNAHSITNSGFHPKGFFQDMWRTISNGNIWRGEICNKKKTGEAYWVDTTIVPFSDQNGMIYQYTAIRTDITKRKEAELEISFMAYHDPLTGLPNRRHLFERLGNLLESQNDTELVGVALFDFDKFKYINDHHGHQAGDDLLIMMANRLLSFIRPREIAARLGGDEFVLAIPGLSSKDELSVRMNELIETMKEPYTIEGRPYYLSLSIGVTYTEAGSSTITDLLNQADFAMYESKNGQSSGFRFFKQPVLTKN